MINKLILLSLASVCFCAPNDDLPECGFKQETRIIGGQNAGYLEWPWQASVRYRDWIKLVDLPLPIFNSHSKHICGGTIVDDNWIMTAGHCIKSFNPKRFTVRLGEHRLKTQDSKEEEFGVVRVIRHPRYDPNTIDYDIAMLQLNKTLDLKNQRRHLRKVCIPKEGQINTTSCVATGWGLLDYKGKQPDVLQKVDLKITDQQQCRKQLENINEVTDRMVCAIGKNKSAVCNGDSGGPLQCQSQDNVWYQLGITSWGVECGQEGDNNVFTRVGLFKNWIEQVIRR